MFPSALFARLLRAVFVAAAAATVAFGLLLVFDPLAPSTPATADSAVAQATATQLRLRIDEFRTRVAASEAALDAAGIAPAGAATPDVDAGLDAQLAAATERRDLARRHADTIRAALAADAPVAALPGIRDNAVIGQLLARQATLASDIAEQQARLRPTHPAMRALLAQRTALATQIRSEAASAADALEAEARLDDAQLARLVAQRRDTQASAVLPASTKSPDIAALRRQLTADRAQLDTLVDAYFSALANSAAAPADTSGRTALNANLAIAGLVALVTLLLLALLGGRRRWRRRLADERAWRLDAAADVETAPATDAPGPSTPLRHAS